MYEQQLRDKATHSAGEVPDEARVSVASQRLIRVSFGVEGCTCSSVRYLEAFSVQTSQRCRSRGTVCARPEGTRTVPGLTQSKDYRKEHCYTFLHKGSFEYVR
jgi:hypothetical protein